MDIPCTLFIHRQTFGLSLGAYDRQCSISTHINFHVDIYVYVYIKIYLLCVCVHMHAHTKSICMCTTGMQCSRRPEEGVESLELEFQEVVSHLMWKLNQGLLEEKH